MQLPDVGESTYVGRIDPLSNLHGMHSDQGMCNFGTVIVFSCMKYPRDHSTIKNTNSSIKGR